MTAYFSGSAICATPSGTACLSQYRVKQDPADIVASLADERDFASLRRMYVVVVVTFGVLALPSILVKESDKVPNFDLQRHVRCRYATTSPPRKEHWETSPTYGCVNSLACGINSKYSLLG